jgi:short-subunit dehydrogenase
MMDFSGKTVVITGASAGIGQELAVALAKKGANLVLAARSVDALAETAKRCEAAGGKAIAVATDVADPAACERLIQETVTAFGGIDCLVNNAGMSQVVAFDQITDLTMFERLMRVNYLGAVYCTYFALPHLKVRKGLLVAVSSLTGKTGVQNRTGYSASKHAMQGFFDSLRLELRDTGVDVLVVSPGFVATDIRAAALGADGKPVGESPRDESEGTMSVATCVAIILEAMVQRRREVVMTLRARVGLWLKLIAPDLVDRITLRTARLKPDA